MTEAINLKDFKLKSNHILVKLDKRYDMLEIDGPLGKKIEIQLIAYGEQEVNHYSISGTVIKKPEQLFYFTQEDKMTGDYDMQEFGSRMKESLQYNCTFDFNEGDKVYFNYNAQLDAEKEGRIVDTIEHGLCILINYNSLYGYLRSNDIVPVNGYVFFKRDQNEREVTFEHGLIGIQEVKPYDNNFATVVSSDIPVKGYLDGGMDNEDYFEPGTRILVDKRFGHRMAYDLHGGDLKNIEVCHRKNVLFVLEETT